MVHTGEKLFTCLGCDKTFNGSKALSNHSRIHTVEKSFACPDCDETFISRSRMKKHSRNHSGEKPFACRDCNTGKEHQKIHCDEKPFHLENEVALSICQDTSLCTQSFNLGTNHRKIHREENPDQGRIQGFEKGGSTKYFLSASFSIPAKSS